MFEIRQTETFVLWLKKLRDPVARARILMRIQRLGQDAHFGDVKPVGEKVSELRIHYGPGYRIYFVQQESSIVILLVGGTKQSQTKDIKRAIAMAQEV